MFFAIKYKAEKKFSKLHLHSYLIQQELTDSMTVGSIYIRGLREAYRWLRVLLMKSWGLANSGAGTNCYQKYLFKNTY